MPSILIQTNEAVSQSHHIPPHNQGVSGMLRIRTKPSIHHQQLAAYLTSTTRNSVWEIMTWGLEDNEEVGFLQKERKSTKPSGYFLSFLLLLLTIWLPQVLVFSPFTSVVNKTFQHVALHKDNSKIKDASPTTTPILWNVLNEQV